MSKSDFTPHAAVAKDKISKNPKNIFFIRVLYSAHPQKVKSSRVTSHCHCEGVRSTLKTLSYDCGNPVVICLRANARSAFLFTGSPRSFHSLAMTKGTKWLILQSLTTPGFAHPSNGGELSPQRERNKFLI